MSLIQAGAPERRRAGIALLTSFVGGAAATALLACVLQALGRTVRH